jgi:hypothetical protein
VQRVGTFEPAERSFVDSAILEVRRRYFTPGSAIRGELHRLGPAGARRYILAAGIPDSSEPFGLIRLFVLEQGAPVGRPSSSIIRDELGRFAIDEIADFDADGVADISYCVWSDPRGSPGLRRAIGYRGEEWYAIAIRSGRTECPAQAEP